MTEGYEARIFEYSDRTGIKNATAASRAVVVGFSGGADSTLLLSLMPKIAGHAVVAAAHLDHGLRGAEAKRDLDFCRAFCLSHGVRFFERSEDISALAKAAGIGTEECGRNERYKFFDDCIKELARELSCDESEILVATAHNADDNLETVLFNLTRGTGLRGLRGILPVRDGKYIRPLLCLTSREIRDICAALGIAYVEDSTNAGDDYTRNRIRHGVIPELERINPAVRKAALSTTASAAEDEDFLTMAAEGEIERYGTPFPSERLSALHPAVASRVVIALYKAVSDGSITRRQVEDLLGKTGRGESGRVHLPGSVTAFYGSALEMKYEKEKTAEEAAPFSFELKRGENVFEEYGFSVGVYPTADGEVDPNIYKPLIYKILKNDKIKNRLFIRSRKEGDAYRFGSHTRRLKKLLCDAKIPREKRERLPVFCDGEGIVWVPGFPVRDGLSAKDEKEDAVIITYRVIGEDD